MGLVHAFLSGARHRMDNACSMLLHLSKLRATRRVEVRSGGCGLNGGSDICQYSYASECSTRCALSG
jgi:hypothetical protein